MTVANRMIMGSMHTRMETLDRPLEREIAFYEARARGRIGMIVTGGFAPNAEGLIDPGCFVMNADIDRGYHQELTSAVKQYGVRFIAQLLHAGRYAKVDGCVGPSAIKAPINPRMPHALSTAEVWRTIEDFTNAAVAAHECGYEGVEVMGSEGYLINQFFSSAPISAMTNSAATGRSASASRSRLSARSGRRSAPIFRSCSACRCWSWSRAG